MPEIATYSLNNPVFATYVLTASLMLLKLMLQPWMTVSRMVKANGGMLNPEDLKATPMNANPHPGQLDPNDDVERSRRINRNDLESIPAFLAAGLLFTAVSPPVVLAQILMWSFVAGRAAHFVAYATSQIHEIRAACWTVGSLAVIAMILYTLWAVVAA